MSEGGPENQSQYQSQEGDENLQSEENRSSRRNKAESSRNKREMSMQSKLSAVRSENIMIKPKLTLPVHNRAEQKVRPGTSIKKKKD